MTNKEKVEKQKLVINKKFNDYFKNVEETLQDRSIQATIEEIGEYSDLINNSKKSKSTDKLKAKQKENFSFISEKYVEEYEEIYGKLREDENWMFMASTYFSVGEGHSTCLMVTQALPCSEDYTEDQTELTTTQAHRAIKEFHQEFGTVSLHTLGFHTREAFFEKYSIMIPYSLIKLKDKPCTLTFKTKLQYNFP